MSAPPHRRARAVCVVGVSGVGKSTLAARFAEAHPSEVRHLVGSSILKALIAPDSLSDLDFYPLVRQQTVRAEAVKRLRLIKDQGPSFLLVDGHITLRSPRSGQLQRVFTSADEAFYDAIVLLNAKPETVLSQRANDARFRVAEAYDSLVEHLHEESVGAVEVAERTKMPFLLIESEHIEVRIRAISQFMTDLASSGANVQ